MIRNKHNQKNTLIFQPIDWSEHDIIKDFDMEELDQVSDKFEYDKLSYSVFITGSTLEGKSVCVKVENYKPYFYIKVPESRQLTFINTLKEKCKINKKLSNFQEYKKEFFGFTNNEQYKFAKLVFDSLNNYNNAIRTIKKIFPKNTLYETNFNNFLKMLHEKDLKTTDWIKINDYENISEDTSSCEINVSCDYNTLEHYLEYGNKSAPFLQATFDIETYSSTGSFPSPDIPDDSIIQVSTAFKRFTYSNFECNYIITVKKCSEERIHLKYPDDNIIVKSVNSEKELLLEWAKLINNTDPDIIYHYNGDWFDWHYLYSRASRYKKTFLMAFLKLISRLKPHSSDSECHVCCSKVYNNKIYGCNLVSEYSENSFSSSAYGTSKYRRVRLPGRVNFDILIYIQREFKEKKYTLDYISEKYLNENKVDLDYKKMFELYNRGNPEDIEEIAIYCVKDTKLPQRLVDKLNIFQTLISMANVTFVPIKFLIERGQQIKVYSQIIKLTKQKGYLVPVLNIDKNSEETDEEESFEGATVFEPETGIYFQPVTVCDFSSLYPSIIRANNLCYSTYINDHRYLKLKDIKYIKVECNDKTHYFAQNTKGILPELLSELAKSRKLYKKKMEQETDSFIKDIYNKTQLAYKVSMNSVYGFLAAQMLTCKPIAETVTTIGRNMIDSTKKYIETNYPKSKVIYGDTDSVFVLFNTKSLEKMMYHKKNNIEIDKKLKLECRKEAMIMGIDACKNVTKELFKDPVSLEFEKIYDPFVLVTKKRYFGAYYSSSMETFDYKQCKGLLPNRRDNFILATEAFNKGIDYIIDYDEKGIVLFTEYLKNLVNDIKSNNITDYDKYTIIKKLNDSYAKRTLDNHKGPFKIININKTRNVIEVKIPSTVNISEINDDFKIKIKDLEYQVKKCILTEDDNILLETNYSIPQDIEITNIIGRKRNTNPEIKFINTVLEPNLPHVVLAKIMSKRNPNNPPKTNDRISYLFIKKESKKKNIPMYKKVEEPEYVKRHNLEIDPVYYIEAIRKPIGQILDLFDPNLQKDIF